MRYEYLGTAPADDGDGGVVRPSEVRELAAEPGWGPWRLLDGPEADPEAPPEAKAPDAPRKHAETRTAAPAAGKTGA